MPCGLITCAVLDARLDRLLVRLHHVERARLAALAADVDEDQRVVAAHHLVGEVEPAGAEVEHRPRPRGSSRCVEPLDDLAAEAVVAQPGVADAGDQDARVSFDHLHLGGEEKRKRPVSRSSSWPGVVDVTPRCTLPS